MKQQRSVKAQCATGRKRPDLRRALAVARARVRQAREGIALATAIAAKITTPPVSVPRVAGQPGRFIALCAMQVKWAGLLMALDEDGQVWQYQHMPQTWGPLPMERGALVPYTKKETT